MSSVGARFIGEERSISLNDVPNGIDELQSQCRAYVGAGAGGKKEYRVQGLKEVKE